MDIRFYQQNDFDELSKLWMESGVGSPARNDTQESIEECLRIGGALWLALDQNLIVGSAWLTYDGRRLYLHHMAVLPRYQNQGVGNLLMERCVAFGKEKNKQMKLEVHRANQRAIHLYQKYGFSALGDYDTYLLREYK